MEMVQADRASVAQRIGNVDHEVMVLSKQMTAQIVPKKTNAD